MTPADAIAEAKRAMAAGNFGAALAQLEAIDLTPLEAMAAVRILLRMAECTKALGLKDSNRECHIAALLRLGTNGLLSPKQLTPDTARLALSLAVGAYNPVMAVEYLRALFGALPPLDAGCKISPAVKISVWCKRNRVAIEPIDPSQKFAFDDGRGEMVTYRMAATWHVTVPDGEIVSGWDFPLTADGEVLLGTNYTPPDKAFPFMPHAYCETAPAIAHVWPAEVMRVDADALFLGTPEGHHLGHWLCEFLPRLRAWDKAGGQKLAISASMPKKNRELLARFGVKAKDLIECEVGKRYAFRSLRAVHTARPHEPNPEDVRFLYGALGPGPGPMGEKILYLARDAKTRAPSNATELEAVFKEFGVSEVRLAELDIDQQAELLKGARAIVGVLGTDMLALYNLRPGATVIEMWKDAQFTVGPMCRHIGLDYRLIICSTAEERGAALYKKDSDIVVDCAKLREHLAALSADR